MDRFLAATALFLLVAAACTKDVSRWEAVPTPVPVRAAEPFYVGLDGLRLRSAPSGSAAVVATLRLHERVERDRVENGFAHVRVPRLGAEGWVDNARLLWRLPPKRATTAPAKPVTAAPEPPAPATATPAATEPVAEPTPPPAFRSPSSSGSSVFDPY